MHNCLSICCRAELVLSASGASIAPPEHHHSPTVSFVASQPIRTTGCLQVTGKEGEDSSESSDSDKEGLSKISDNSEG